MVAKGKISSELDSTEVYNTLTLICINPKCADYSGPDTSNPAKVAETIRLRMDE